MITATEAFWYISTLGVSLPGLVFYRWPGKWNDIDNLVAFGKLRPSVAKQWQRFIEVPKSSFLIFYCIASICSTIAVFTILPALLGWTDKAPAFVQKTVAILSDSSAPNAVDSTIALIALFLFTIHSYRRLYETIFVSVFSSGKVNVLHFVLGCAFYFFAVLSMVTDMPCVRAGDRCPPFEARRTTIAENSAIIVFLIAMFYQHQTFKILANLRMDRAGNVISKAHIIPKGGLFKFLTSPHYSCEILLYFCLWMLFGFSYFTGLMFVFVLSNQLLAALATHRWYKEKFREKYPRSRKVIIPFLF
uniref:Polyprenal reductase n=1 Tax=Plectus sambesii TaxID=2011161 RepID=A0A914WFS2_9BILA